MTFADLFKSNTTIYPLQRIDNCFHLKEDLVSSPTSNTAHGLFLLAYSYSRGAFSCLLWPKYRACSQYKGLATPSLSLKRSRAANLTVGR